jgi:UDP-glucose 4-epimerase/UDP-glucuronate 4-epimerase
MTTLVTGASGFVGVNVLEELARRKRDVVAVDALPPPEGAALAASAIRFRTGDLRDEDFLESLFCAESIDKVIHLATITAGGEREYGCSSALVDVNVSCVARLLHVAKRHQCGRLVYVGSGSAYGRTWESEVPLREEESPSRPDSLYGITKLAGEQIALRLGELSGLDVRAVRLGTVFGPWERETGARDAMSLYLQLARFALVGSEAVLPSAIARRDWIYSRDAARGIADVLACAHTRHRVYHLTSGMEWSDGLALWCQALAANFAGFTWRAAEPGEQPNVVDTARRNRAPMLVDRIRDEVGFVARFGPGAACEDFAAWLKRNGAFVIEGSIVNTCAAASVAAMAR